MILKEEFPKRGRCHSFKISIQDNQKLRSSLELIYLINAVRLFFILCFFMSPL